MSEGLINTGDCNIFFQALKAEYVLFLIHFSSLSVSAMCIALLLKLYIMDTCILLNVTSKRKNMYCLSKFNNIKSTTMLTASLDAKLEDIKKIVLSLVQKMVEILAVWCCHNVLGESMAIVSKFQKALYTLNSYFIKCIAVGVVYGAVHTCLVCVRQSLNNLHNKLEKNNCCAGGAVIISDQLSYNTLSNNVILVLGKILSPAIIVINYFCLRGDYRIVFGKKISW